MKRFSLTLVLLLVLFSIASVFYNGLPAQANGAATLGQWECTLKITVVTRHDQPVPYAYVIVRNHLTQEKLAEGETTENGNFSAEVARYGRYDVGAHKDGIGSGSNNNVPCDGAANSVIVELTDIEK